MNKHSAGDLKQMQSLPLDAKIRMSQRRIEEWYDHWDGMVYIAFSGGIDSLVLKHLVETTPGVHNVPSLFVNTGLEYPELQRFAMSQPNVTTVRPDIRFDDVLKRYGYPVISKTVSDMVCGARRSLTKGEYSARLRLLGVSPDEYGGLSVNDKYNYEKIAAGSKFERKKYRYLLDANFDSSAECCYWMKKKPSADYAKKTGRKPFIGTMAEESALRETSWLKNGCNAFDLDKPASRPLSFWTKQDILHYIKRFNLEYCSVYGDIRVKVLIEEKNGQTGINNQEQDEDGTILETTGCDRTGCIFCMFGCHLEKEPNRFQRLKETHPRQYEYCIGGGEMVDGKWRPSKEGLGLGKVLDYIGCKYE